jgi:hypothetical protein
MAKPTAARSLTCGMKTLKWCGTIVNTARTMSTIGNCQLCVYWAQELDYNTGSCRRYAPEPAPGKEQLAVWPLTLNTNWCGEFKRGTYALKGA